MSAQRAYPQTRFARPPGATDVLLVRHGQSAALVDGEPFPMLDGQGDPPLSDVGRDQAEKLCARLAGEDISAVYVTTMCRTQQTAEPLAVRLGITPTVEPDLREIHLGDWEGGLLRKMAAENHPAYERVHLEERWDAIPGAESSEAFRARCVTALGRIVAAHPDEQIAVFVHGGVIGTVLAHAAGARGFAFAGADNGSVSQIVVTDQRWFVRRFNDSSHLWPTLSTAIDEMS